MGDYPPGETGPGEQTAFFSIGTGVKVRPGRAADHILPSTVGVKEE